MSLRQPVPQQLHLFLLREVAGCSPMLKCRQQQPQQQQQSKQQQH
jgi:hypothetical protein